MEAVRHASFGERYQLIREKLQDRGTEEKKKEFRDVEDTLLFLIPYILTNQSEDGWWNPGNPYHKVLTAHALRLLHQLGLTLRSRWGLHGTISDKGNLFYSTVRLLESFDVTRQRESSLWADDVWDDCWILIALLEVQQDFADTEIQKWKPKLTAEFKTALNASVKWLQKQITKKGFTQRITDDEWFGPAHYAAAIELFHRLTSRNFPKAKQTINMLVAGVKTMLRQSLRSSVTPEWERNGRFAWHAGQVIVTWEDKRKTYRAIKSLDPLMDELLKKLKDSQDQDGFWGPKTLNKLDKIYNTDRALEALYVTTNDDDLLTSTGKGVFNSAREINLAHKYLLAISRNKSGPIEDIKGSINTLEAFQRLFDFRIRDIVPNELWTLASRLNKHGFMSTILSSHDNDPRMLEEIRARARSRLEEHGRTGLEMLGVNYRIYESLERRDEFLKEFTADREKELDPDDREDILTELKRFLSSTLTETRSKSSRRLITRLWQPDGFLYFIPLINHLSDLEQDRAFYKYYRDHLNHEVLLFLLGAYIYYNCEAFRKPVDEEIRRISEVKKIPPPKDLESEFLFRWKLISTFHDIGYLFEVEPFKDKSLRRTRSKSELLKKSFRVVDEFRETFLFDYFNHYASQKREEDETVREKEVRQLANKVGRSLKTYPGRITAPKDLLKLTTGGAYGKAFKLISQYVKPTHIYDGLIEDYFKLCSSTAPRGLRDGSEIEKRPKFYDHGIMSALVLLKAADIQRHYLKQLSDKAFSGGLLDDHPQLTEMLERPKTKADLAVQQFFIRFSHVAGAIALHNITPHLYMREQCRAFDKRNKKRKNGLERAFYGAPRNKPGRYTISLNDNPLSYLTALADTLQDWDRHSFRRLSFEEDLGDPLSSSEIIIDLDGNGINVRPLTDQAKEKYGSMTNPEAMDQYLKDWRKYVTIHQD